jgi:hypothetical protein
MHYIGTWLVDFVEEQILWLSIFIIYVDMQLQVTYLQDNGLASL